jgi:hypothetical protein
MMITNHGLTVVDDRMEIDTTLRLLCSSMAAHFIASLKWQEQAAINYANRRTSSSSLLVLSLAGTNKLARIDRN